MLRMEGQFISHGRSHKDCIHKCAAKVNSRGEGMGAAEEGGLRPEKTKGTTLAKS